MFYYLSCTKITLDQTMTVFNLFELFFKDSEMVFKGIKYARVFSMPISGMKHCFLTQLRGHFTNELTSKQGHQAVMKERPHFVKLQCGSESSWDKTWAVLKALTIVSAPFGLWSSPPIPKHYRQCWSQMKVSGFNR